MAQTGSEGKHGESCHKMENLPDIFAGRDFTKYGEGYYESR